MGNERAGIWLRVSDDHQDETNQLPDLQGFCGRHGYAVEDRHVFRVHGKSAWKPGRLDEDKRRVLDAFRSGEIQVLAVWAVDRWAREGIADLFHGMKLVNEAGGRVEFVQDAILNVPGDVQELLLAVLGWVARMESKRRSDRTKNGMARRRGEGAVMGGSVPFGYRLADGIQFRDEDALKVVAEVFERSARGESTATIAEFIRRSGYKRADNTVADILRNPVYVAEKVVSGTLARTALDGLEERRKGTVRRTSEEDYSGMIQCPCGKPMHRKLAGGIPGKAVEPTRYYRCNDHEGNPKPMVRADDADALVEHVMRDDWLPWMVPVRTGGDTRASDEARAWLEIDKAQKRRDRDEVSRLFGVLDEIAAAEPEPERTEWVPSGKTRGDHWAELTVAERRAWLGSEDTEIVAWNVKEVYAGDRWATEDSWALGKVRLRVEVNEPG